MKGAGGEAVSASLSSVKIAMSARANIPVIHGLDSVPRNPPFVQFLLMGRARLPAITPLGARFGHSWPLLGCRVPNGQLLENT